MQLTVYFLDKKLHVITLTINGVEYAVADLRATAGDPTEICICTSNTYAKKGNHTDCDADLERLIESGTVVKREIEVTPIEMDWRPYSISYTLVKHPQLAF